ncbi:MAG: DUF3179 domain-containing protein [Chloroflexi bacterium]|nr:DUF3179 domain-containing protein [Chloroflexota bacterium]
MNGRALVFGNQGALYLNAMTWWDHETESLWSQPLGEAIGGALLGTQLELLPSSTVPWATWRAEHPQTLALFDESYEQFNLESRKSSQDNYIIGVVLGDQSRAYPYRIASAEQLVQDQIGNTPLLVLVEPQSHSVHVFVRATGAQTLTFALQGDALIDQPTHSTWDRAHGIAMTGPLKGAALRPFPYIPAYARAWRDFHPESWFYQGKGVFQKP